MRAIHTFVFVFLFWLNLEVAVSQAFSEQKHLCQKLTSGVDPVTFSTNASVVYLYHITLPNDLQPLTNVYTNIGCLLPRNVNIFVNYYTSSTDSLVQANSTDFPPDLRSMIGTYGVTHPDEHGFLPQQDFVNDQLCVVVGRTVKMFASKYPEYSQYPLHIIGAQMSASVKPIDFNKCAIQQIIGDDEFVKNLVTLNVVNIGSNFLNTSTQPRLENTCEDAGNSTIIPGAIVPIRSVKMTANRAIGMRITKFVQDMAFIDQFYANCTDQEVKQLLDLFEVELDFAGSKSNATNTKSELVFNWIPYIANGVAFVLLFAVILRSCVDKNFWRSREHGGRTINLNKDKDADEESTIQLLTVATSEGTTPDVVDEKPTPESSREKIPKEMRMSSIEEEDIHL